MLVVLVVLAIHCWPRPPLLAMLAMPPLLVVVPPLLVALPMTPLLAVHLAFCTAPLDAASRVLSLYLLA